MKRALIGIFSLILIASFSVIVNGQSEGEGLIPTAFWQKLASPGELSSHHGDLGDDCNACHTPVKGPSPAKCMGCHAANENFRVWPQLQFHLAAPECQGCHREHLGTGSIATAMDHNLIAQISLDQLRSHSAESEGLLEHTEAKDKAKAGISETDLRCVNCHMEKDAHSAMFGRQCSSCHTTQVWTISEYRHPSTASTSCSQCHRAPPCHFTAHFEKVCGPVAGQPNARVSDCHSCHQVPSWNSIKGVGWYISH